MSAAFSYRALLARAGELIWRNPIFLLLGFIVALSAELVRLLGSMQLPIISLLWLFVFGLAYTTSIAGIAVDYFEQGFSDLSLRAARQYSKLPYARVSGAVTILAIFGSLPLLFLVLMLLVAATVALPPSLEPWLVLARDPVSYSNPAVYALPFLGAVVVLSILVFAAQAAIYDAPASPYTRGAVLTRGLESLGTAWRVFRANFRRALGLLAIILVLSLAVWLVSAALDSLAGFWPVPDVAGSWNNINPRGLAVALTTLVTHTILEAPLAAFILALWPLFYRRQRNTIAPAEQRTAAAITSNLASSRSSALPVVAVGVLALALSALAGAQFAYAARQNAPQVTWPSRLVAKQSGILYDLALSADNQFMATCASSGLFDSNDYVRLWDVSRSDVPAQPLGDWRTNGGCRSVAFSADGKALAAGDESGHVWLLDLGNRAAGLHSIFTASQYLDGLAFSPDSKTLAIGAVNTFATLLDVQGKNAPIQLVSDYHTTDQLAYSPDGQILASVGSVLNIWKPAESTVAKRIDGNYVLIRSLAFDHSGKILATGANGPQNGTNTNWNLTLPATVQFRDSVSGAPMTKSYTIPAQFGVESMAFSPDEQWLAVGAEGLFLIDYNNTGTVARLPVKSFSVYALAFSRDGRTLYVGESGGDVRAWTLPTP